jgi:hypothetical protein
MKDDWTHETREDSPQFRDPSFMKMMSENDSSLVIVNDILAYQPLWRLLHLFNLIHICLFFSLVICHFDSTSHLISTSSSHVESTSSTQSFGIQSLSLNDNIRHQFLFVSVLCLLCSREIWNFSLSLNDNLFSFFFVAFWFIFYRNTKLLVDVNFVKFWNLSCCFWEKKYIKGYAN